MLDLPVTRAVIEMLGEVALLLWGVHMISTGVMRGFGGDLRRVLGKALRHRLTALLAGLGVTLVLQSSTATALMASSFAAAGVIGPVPALATMLGANIGTALVTWALAFDVTLMFPVLLLAGLIMFRVTSRTRPRNIGRALIGLGLVLLALHLLVETFAPGTVAPQARDIVAALTREPLVVLALATLLTWAMHSSIAAVLVIATLAQAGLVTPVAALAMVLGANLGSALNPLVNALSGEPAAIRLPLGNLINRLTGCALALPLLAEIRGLLAGVAPGPGRTVVLFHLAFNVALAALFMPALPALASLLERRAARPAAVRTIPRRRAISTGAHWPHRPSPSPMRRGRPCGWPMSSRACLPGRGELLDRDDLRLAVRLRRMDDVLDRLHSELKQFLGRARAGRAKRGGPAQAALDTRRGTESRTCRRRHRQRPAQPGSQADTASAAPSAGESSPSCRRCTSIFWRSSASPSPSSWARTWTRPFVWWRKRSGSVNSSGPRPRLSSRGSRQGAKLSRLAACNSTSCAS